MTNTPENKPDAPSLNFIQEIVEEHNRIGRFGGTVQLWSTADGRLVRVLVGDEFGTTIDGLQFLRCAHEHRFRARALERFGVRFEIALQRENPDALFHRITNPASAAGALHRA